MEPSGQPFSHLLRYPRFRRPETVGAVEPLTIASVVHGGPRRSAATGSGIRQPPGWDFTHFAGEPDILGCELLTCTATIGCL
ncbi:MAG: hypothetical protein NUK54_04530 [Methanothrix sp.]|nr:hypothetical protein [Methanothrix sp.]